jgi:hypothetical protein
MAFAKKQASEILLNLSHLLIHPIKVLEIYAETGKKNKGDDRPPRQRRGQDLTGDGNGAVGHSVAGGGEVGKFSMGRGARS